MTGLKGRGFSLLSYWFVGVNRNGDLGGIRTHDVSLDRGVL